MKLGFNLLLWTTHVTDAHWPIIERLQSTGYDGVEIPLFEGTVAHYEALGKRLKAAGLASTGIGVMPGAGKHALSADPAERAGALTHLATGLTVAIHTGRGPGLEQLDVLRDHGVAPSAYIWVHAQGAADDALFAAADRGAWISCDGLNRNTVTRHLHLCREFKKRGQLGRVLLSHDAGWFDPAKPGGGTFRPFDLLSTVFLPLLRREDFSDSEIDLLTVRNPAEAFALRVRPAQ
jgi:phosphotriesterase-related protein